jgi:hypothetical protein
MTPLGTNASGPKPNVGSQRGIDPLPGAANRSTALRGPTYHLLPPGEQPIGAQLCAALLIICCHQVSRQ